MGLTSATASSRFLDKGKGVLSGSPSGFVPKKSLVLSPIQDSGHLGLFSNISSIESIGSIFKFDSEDFRSLWSKLEQFFEAEGLQEQTKITWDTYARDFKDRFGSSTSLDLMTELVALKQQGTMDAHHDQFVSILNQLRLPESYALSIP
ncbi:hypothetical protein PVK06_002193 [Gossypium arboreum]|uniref:Retrotransposon gag domain-containing protein n=1 Tax=Gossypium arboreum TaxID=29729 RepID=A0ABR0R444_GOSAR|nr:hypothetical protein PVK06_002193 [Gossypium arboreum]